MSRTLRTLYMGENQTQQLKPLRMLLNEASKIKINWSSLLASLGTTISTSTWSTEDSGRISLTSPTNASGITGVTLGASSMGRAIAKNTVVLANGETYIRDYYLIITDPTAIRWGDYGWNDGYYGV